MQVRNVCPYESTVFLLTLDVTTNSLNNVFLFFKIAHIFCKLHFFNFCSYVLQLLSISKALTGKFIQTGKLSVLKH